ncbi:hypothetical protein GCM10028824_28430 [Hymenobacter segetis]|uniref:Outer membrane protein beta-barrel domain-containing protein n=1 Tax=Hymenobacter segetis TaxID=2025509 RepID=A0ABU9LUN7_9BACT
MTRYLGAGLLAALLLGARAGAAQSRPAADSAGEVAGPPCPAAVAPRRRVGFVISLDNRESFVQSSAVHIIGANAGVVLPGRRWRLGLGGYTLSRDYTALYIYQYKNGKRTKKAPDTLTPQLDLTYFTPNVSYVFFQRPWLEISLPLEVGLGRSHYTVTDQTGRTTTDSRGLFVPVEAGLAVLVKPFRWVGVSGSVGYRKSVFEIDYKDDFDGMYFSYRLNVFVGVIWRDLRQYHQNRRLARELAQAQRGR